MKSIAITILLVFQITLTSTYGQEKNAREMEGEEALAKLKRSEIELNKAYLKSQKEVIEMWGEAADNTPLKELKQSQSAWLKWRDIESEVTALERSGGGYTRSITAIYEKTAMNKARTKRLNGEESATLPVVEAEIVNPKRGSTDRTAICAAFRVPMTKEVNGQKIVFVIHTLNVMGDWAFINSSLQLANGKRVNWNKTKYRDDAKAGDLENNAIGLFRRNSQGKWVVMETSFNATDAWYIGWAKYYRISDTIFNSRK